MRADGIPSGPTVATDMAFGSFGSDWIASPNQASKSWKGSSTIMSPRGISPNRMSVMGAPGRRHAKAGMSPFGRARSIAYFAAAGGETRGSDRSLHRARGGPHGNRRRDQEGVPQAREEAAPRPQPGRQEGR